MRGIVAEGPCDLDGLPGDCRCVGSVPGPMGRQRDVEMGSGGRLEYKGKMVEGETFEVEEQRDREEAWDEENCPVYAGALKKSKACTVM